MPMRRPFLAATVGLLISGVLSPGVAEACMCGGSFCGSVATATTIFEATVVSEEPDPSAGNGTKTIRLTDIRPIRGVAPRVLELQGSSCDLELKVGARYLIEPHEWAPGKFGVSQCSLTRPAVRAAGFHAFLRTPSPEDRPRVWGTLTVPTVDHRSYLERGGGLAVAGAVVLLDGPVQRTAATSSNGEFSFSALPDGRYGVRVELPAGRSDVTAPEPMTVEVGGAAVCADVDLVARSAARVVGVVVDVRGAPVPNVQVDLFTPPYNPFRRDFHHLLAGSDDSGRFEFVNLPPGIYQAGVGVPEPAEYRPFAPVLAQNLANGRRELSVGLGEVVELSPLVARRVEPVTVHGVVTGAPGVSLDGLDIVVGAVDAGEAGGIRVGRTDVDGRFTAELYRTVRYRMRARSGDRQSDRLEFVAGDAPITLRLQP
jgi:hypothetical protein